MPSTLPARSSLGGTIGSTQPSYTNSGSSSTATYAYANAVGILSAAGGARRAAPELVVPFALPSTADVDEWREKRERSKGARDVRGAKGRKRRRRSEQSGREESSASESDASSNSDDDEEASDDELLSIQESSTLLQSLRQSRLLHLTSLLPAFSTRQRAGVTYGVPVALPRNLDPRQPHVLVQLGRADVRVGPHVFARTKFWEVRSDESRTAPAPAPAPPKPAVATTAKGKAPAQAAPPARPAAAAAAPAQASRPPISPALVQRVNLRAANDPTLQQLLHVAASGSASSEQLQVLGTWIQGITEELRAEGVRIDEAPSTVAPPAAGTAARAAPPSATASKQPGASTATSTSSSVPQLPALPSPPIIIVEFRENPSARFVLPIWKGASIERRVKDIPATAAAAGGASSLLGKDNKDEVRVTFWVPAVGSEASNEELPDAAGTDSAAARKEANRVPVTKFPVTWSLRAVNETVWDTFGRYEGAVTRDELGNEVVLDTKEDAGRKVKDETARKQVASEFLTLYKALPKEMTQLAHQIPAQLGPHGLEDHLTDRFGVRVQHYASRPVAKRKMPSNVTLIDEEVSMVGSSSATSAFLSKSGPAKLVARASPAVASSQARHVTVNPDGTPGSPLVKIKRKRHVATHNPDGSRKSCGACGTLSTPMWRRGPAGPSQLCNACGARWKAGRLVVPDVPPPPKYNEEKVQRKPPTKPADKLAAQAAAAAAGTASPSIAGPFAAAGATSSPAAPPSATLSAGSTPAAAAQLTTIDPRTLSNSPAPVDAPATQMTPNRPSMLAASPK